jgi:hypothetical protein
MFGESSKASRLRNEATAQWLPERLDGGGGEMLVELAEV